VPSPTPADRFGGHAGPGPRERLCATVTATIGGQAAAVSVTDGCPDPNSLSNHWGNPVRPRVVKLRLSLLFYAELPPGLSFGVHQALQGEMQVSWLLSLSNNISRQ